jgi:hypothetical protein
MSPRKVDSPRKRMREVIYKFPKIKRGMTPHKFFADSSPEVQDLNWINSARAAFRLDDNIIFQGKTIPNPATAAIRRLFASFNLDPADPFAWRELVQCFAYAEHWQAPPRKRGRPGERDDRKTAELLAEIKANPGMSAKALAKKLVNNPKSRFNRATVTTASGSALRKRIGKLKAGN